MMADIRMLQEQNQLLQRQLSAITDALKGLNQKLDEQAGVARKSFADQKLLVDTISTDLRVVREKVDDNNVRISSLSQELEALRMAVPQGGAPLAPTGGEPQPAAGGAAPATPPASTPAAPGMSPQRMFEMALADYMGEHYDLAIQGFDGYVKSFPKSEQAGEALYWMGETYFVQGKYRDAITHYDRSIAEYPNGRKVPEAYFKRGVALSNIGQVDRARESWEFVMKTFPNSDSGRLAKQKLDQLPKRD